VLLALSAGLFVFLVVPLPRFDDPAATVVYSAGDELLGARIASDGQWRFPKTDSVPAKYKVALLAYEDRWFFVHPGVNPFALARALWMNVKNRRVVSGGSTLTMQLARLSRKNPPRTISSKMLEILMALKLETVQSKKEILCRYASSAPFGGNVVGIDAASWRYFKRPANSLSWAEAATLAVLPNAPSLLYPGKNSTLLKNKRDRLLQKLHLEGRFDSLTYRLSLAEPLPLKPNPLPDRASHAVALIQANHAGRSVRTTLSHELQTRVEAIVEQHHNELAQNDIHNLAALVVGIESGNILAWVGNAPDPENRHGGKVDLVTSSRSSGSILKPFLYAAMINDGELLSHSLVRDVPINFSGYAPKNFDYTYSGAVPASLALSQSLNVPAVDMLHRYGIARFLNVLRGYGFTTFHRTAEYYGLSLILGGAETNLFELAGVYASMARTLQHYHEHEGYNRADFRMPSLFPHADVEESWDQQPIIRASSVWFMLQALQEVNRPEGRTGWWNFPSSGTVAWKTGTSFGYRDAWAVAITHAHVLAVWVGNADGEGRAGLTGLKAAAPVLFDILDLLPKNTWFEKPRDEMTSVNVCVESGFKAGPDCPNKRETEIPVSGLKTGVCPYHRRMHFSDDGCWLVNSSCYPPDKMIHDSCFILPPAMEWYYRKLHPEYRVLPPVMEGCTLPDAYPLIELLYPNNLERLYIPIEMNGERGSVVFEAAHRNMGTRIFWHLDDAYVGETDHFHQMALSPGPGKHILRLMDRDGNILETAFFVEKALYERERF